MSPQNPDVFFWKGESESFVCENMRPKGQMKVITNGSTIVGLFNDKYVMAGSIMDLEMVLNEIEQYARGLGYVPYSAVERCPV